MQHLLLRQNKWYFHRRVPTTYREYDSRQFVRLSLNTDSKTQAARLATLQNAKLENYWQSLVETGKKHAHDYFLQTVKRSEILGFPYIQTGQLAQGNLAELVERVLFIVNQQFNPIQTEAILGGVDEPVIRLDDALAKFWDLSKDIALNKTDKEVKKWKNPRRLAMQNLIACIGNKALKELSRDDLLKFRDWWITRIEEEDYSPATANKNFVHSKMIISKVSDNYKLDIDIKHIFAKLEFDDDDEIRPPFSTDYILNVLLAPTSLKGMNEVSQAMLMVFAETGVSISEQIKLLPEDIIIDDEIPHIIIRPKKKMQLKTKYRKRIMPLTGLALAAFRKYPQGFRHWGDNADSISSAIGKYLRENNLLPTDKHTTYSLRHSFQDRLLSVNTPDRIQAELMGHKFQRPSYGDGATLAHKLEWMEKIKLGD